MSMLGKILALVNIVAAIGFVYLGLSDYGKRQQWSYAVYRHDLAIDGLPVDDNEKDVDSNSRAKDLSKATLADMFQGTGGEPVTTQAAEVQKVQGQLQSKIVDGQPMTVPNLYYGNPPTINLETAAQKRAWFLLPLARTLSERDPLMAQLFNPKEEKVDAAAFDKPFTDVLAKPDAGDKKQAIADLLFGLLSATPPVEGQPDFFETPGYKRFVVVVGRKAAAGAIDSAAAQLAQLTRETEDLLAANRTTFATAHDRTIARMRDLADEAQREKDALDTQKNQTDRQQQVVAQRGQEVKNLEGQLDAARQTTKDYLAKQQKLQEATIKAQQNLRDANSKNRDLVKQIEKMEGSRE